MTRNTGECLKYDKEGTLQKSFSGNSAVGQKRHGSSKTSNSFGTVKKTQKSL